MYHASNTGDIAEFELRKRYTPSKKDTPARVYASPIPAFAAAHSFPWSSDEGFDVKLENDQTVLVVPEQHKAHLNQEVFLYKLKGNSFELTKEESTGETYHATQAVVPMDVKSFNSVVQAVEFYDGRVEII